MRGLSQEVIFVLGYQEPARRKFDPPGVAAHRLELTVTTIERFLQSGV